MNIQILTLFPEMFKGPFDYSIISRAKEKGLVEISVRNLRDWAIDKHRSVDNKPYGGGRGMILRVDIIDRALHDLKIKMQKSKCKMTDKNAKRIKTALLTPQGRVFSQAKARELSKCENLLLICGHYEGFDERVRSLVDEEISIGEYILTGGELPAMVITDTVVRLIPGVLPKGVTSEESFSMRATYKLQAKLEYPQYTVPREYKGMRVPEVLLNGNHQEIKKWRLAEARKRTGKRQN